MKHTARKAGLALIPALAVLAPAVAQQFVQQGRLLNCDLCTSGGVYGGLYLGFGGSVAISADGNTAVVGGRSVLLLFSQVVVLTRSGGVWTFVQRLDPPNLCCFPNSWGWSVAL